METNNTISVFQRLKQMVRCCSNNKHKAVIKATCDDTCCHGKQVLVIAYDEKSSDSDSTDISIESDNKVKIS